MIVLLTGVPGSGKTYRAVHHINELLSNPDNVVFSNISGFRFERWLLIHGVEKFRLGSRGYTVLSHGSYVDISPHLVSLGASFFSKDNIEKIVKSEKYVNKHCYFFIDECQQYFPHFFKDTSVIFLFDYHRHLGIDIFLITQDVSKICTSIAKLAEYEIRAIPSSLRFTRSFVYKKMINGEILSRDMLGMKPYIYSMYKSFDNSSSSSSRSYMLYFILFFVFLVFYGFFKLFTGFGAA